RHGRYVLRYCIMPSAHRRGETIPVHFVPANRAASSKQARLIRRRRRFACFPGMGDMGGMY
ncbi:MAG: hypothetical protein IKC24_03725, partial [Oscillospiraceae bacterium]|nr:hypothetical protein [Oscillospiraceae bacterium]